MSKGRYSMYSEFVLSNFALGKATARNIRIPMAKLKMVLTYVVFMP
jgi:hypothetical protein